MATSDRVRRRRRGMCCKCCCSWLFLLVLLLLLANVLLLLLLVVLLLLLLVDVCGLGWPSARHSNALVNTLFVLAAASAACMAALVGGSLAGRP